MATIRVNRISVVYLAIIFPSHSRSIQSCHEIYKHCSEKVVWFHIFSLHLALVKSTRIKWVAMLHIHIKFTHGRYINANSTATLDYRVIEWRILFETTNPEEYTSQTVVQTRARFKTTQTQSNQKHFLHKIRFQQNVETLLQAYSLISVHVLHTLVVTPYSIRWTFRTIWRSKYRPSTVVEKHT